MARLMLTVGDLQVSVQPVTGSVSEFIREHYGLSADHPLAVGDHEVEFYEINPDGGKDNHCSAIMGENDALQLVAAWLQVDEEGPVGQIAKEHVVNAFPREIAWLLP